MASRMRAPTLALAGLSMCLALAIVGTAGRSLHVLDSQRGNDPWLLPLWPDRIDSQELQVLIGTSGAIVTLNGILALSLVVASLPANTIVVISSFLSAMAAATALAFATITNAHAPGKDTLQTWTCRWSATQILIGESPPNQFQGLCMKTRFAYWATIPLLVIQIILLGVGIYALAARPARHERHHQIEKQQDFPLHDVGSMRSYPYEAKTEARRIYQDSNGYYGVTNIQRPLSFRFLNTANESGHVRRSSLMDAVMTVHHRP